MTKNKQLGLFDIIKLVFVDANKIYNTSDAILKKHSFMVNRILAIQYPVHAQSFQQYGCNGANLIKAWASFFSQQGFRYPPKFIYTPGGKKLQQREKVKSKYVEKDIREMCNFYGVSYNDYKACLEFYPELVDVDMEEYIDLQKQIKDPTEEEKNKKSKKN